MANSADPAMQQLTKSAVEGLAITKVVVDAAGIPLDAGPLTFMGLPVQYLSYTS